jgi:magnesium transporter
LTSEAPSPSTEAPIWVRVRELLEAGDAQALGAFVDALPESDCVHAFDRLSGEERTRTLQLLGPERAAALLETIPDAHAARAMGELAPRVAAEILEELQSDDRADLMGQLSAGDAEAILAEARPRTAANVRRLLRFDPETAGGLMVTEYVAVPETATTQDVVAELRANAERYANFVAQYVYVIAPGGELRGVLRLRDLLLAPAGRPLASVMIRDPVVVPATAPLEELFEVFDRHAFVAVPVVDADGVMLGLLLREDVDEARVDRAASEGLKARGIVGGEELRSLPVMTRSARRLSWLSINIVLNVIAASVIALFEDTLRAVIALAVFLPIISDMSGCSGNQAVAVSLRELSLGVTRPHEILRVLLKESSVGILNGVALGLLIAGVAWLWKGDAVLGIVVGAALALNTLVAVCIGGVVPLVIRRLGFDPALASGPMLTTVTDMCGFFLVLGFATLALSRLAA